METTSKHILRVFGPDTLCSHIIAQHWLVAHSVSKFVIKQAQTQECSLEALTKAAQAQESGYVHEKTVSRSQLWQSFPGCSGYAMAHCMSLVFAVLKLVQSQLLQCCAQVLFITPPSPANTLPLLKDCCQALWF